mmetsp:Transcript_53041/g.171151  ORF Transcript_53041/g.171151 Transcript_53041/m.171151 type:complete len:534 (-) Transcript_53041:2278-3879(-)
MHRRGPCDDPASTTRRNIGRTHGLQEGSLETARSTVGVPNLVLDGLGVAAMMALLLVVQEGLLRDEAGDLAEARDEHQLDAQPPEDVVHLGQWRLGRDPKHGLVDELREVQGALHAPGGVALENHGCARAHQRTLEGLLDVLAQRIRMHVTQEREVPGRGDQREASEVHRIEGLLQVPQRRRLRIQALQALIHDVAGALPEALLAGLVQVGIAAQDDNRIVDSVREAVADELGGEHRQHEGHDELQGVRQAKHDDDQRDGDPADSTQHSRSPNHCIDARVDGSGREVVLTVEPRHEHAQYATHASSSVQGGNEQAARHACAEGERHLDVPQHRCHGQRKRRLERQERLAGEVVAKARHVDALLVRPTARLEERPDRRGGHAPGERRGPTGCRGEQGYDGDLNHDVHLVAEGRAVLPGLTDLDVAPHEDGSEHAADGAEEDKPRVLRQGRHLHEVRLEHRELACACRVVPTKGQGGDHRCEEGPRHGRLREHGADLLVREQDAAERSSERDGDARRGGGADQLAALRLVLDVAG